MSYDEKPLTAKEKDNQNKIVSALVAFAIVAIVFLLSECN